MNAEDFDLCETCRVSGQFAGGTGFLRIPDPAFGLRLQLQALLDWWPLIMKPEHMRAAGLLKATGVPVDLATMGLPALRQAALNLPG